MGILSTIKSFFVGGDNTNSRLPDVHQSAITPETFTPNQDNLYVSSELVREANNRGWIVDDELVKQSGLIAKNVKKNVVNVKKLGKNIKEVSKGEVVTAKEMAKIIALTANNDSKKYGINSQTQSVLDQQTLAMETIKANYRERVKANNQRLNELLNNSKSSRERLKGR